MIIIKTIQEKKQNSLLQIEKMESVSTRPESMKLMQTALK